MADWKTDSDLYEVADQLGHKIVDMYTKAGVFISAGVNKNAVLDSVRSDADIYLSLDPQKILDEFTRMQRAAEDIGKDAVARSLLQAANNKLTGGVWHGEAAEAFGHQMTYIEVFAEQQESQIAFAAHCMGTAYSLAIQARRSYHDLAGATIAACDKEMKQQTDRDNKAMVGIFSEIAKACISGWGTPAKGVDAARWGINTFVEMGAKTHEVVVEGSDAPDVVSSYLRAESELKHSFEDGLTELTKWINLQESGLSQDKIPLLEPLPLCTDVNSPDFSYGKFFNTERDPGTFGPKTEQERRKIQEERNRPAGLISQRLDGGQS